MNNSGSLAFRIVEFIFRIIGGIIGCLWGLGFAEWSLNLFGVPSFDELLIARIAFFLVFGLSGFFNARSAGQILPIRGLGGAKGHCTSLKEWGAMFQGPLPEDAPKFAMESYRSVVRA